MSFMIRFVSSPSPVLSVLVSSVVSSDSWQCLLRVVATKEVDQVSQALHPYYTPPWSSRAALADCPCPVPWIEPGPAWRHPCLGTLLDALQLDKKEIAGRGSEKRLFGAEEVFLGAV